MDIPELSVKGRPVGYRLEWLGAFSRINEFYSAYFMDIRCSFRKLSVHPQHVVERYIE